MRSTTVPSIRGPSLRRCALPLAGLAWIATGCAAPAPRNVLLVVIDTLRWDHVGSYGYERDTTPALDAFARESVRFERAYATAPWTMPSVASILTGLYPSGHGVKTVMSGTPMSLHTLPEILRERGFQTAGVVSNKLLVNPRARGKGLTQGYDIYLASEARGHDHVSTPGVTDQAVRILERFARDGHRFLLFAHYFDPHFNYRNHKDIPFAPARMGGISGREDIAELRERLPDLSDEEMRFLRNLYDEEIRYTDRGIGRLLASVEQLGLKDSTLVVVTSDHGEEFRERGWLGHTRTLYEELTRVPLLIRAPGGCSGHVVHRPVSLVALAPTILDLLEVDRSELTFHERSLSELVRSGKRGEDEYVLAEVDFVDPGRPDSLKRAFKKAIMGARYKLIREDETQAVELYDLVEDPLERRNLADEHPELRDRLLEALEQRLASATRDAPESAEREFSAEDLERLRELGYADP